MQEQTYITENLNAKTARGLTQNYYDTQRKNALFDVLKQICAKATSGKFICGNIQVPIKHGDYVITELGTRGFGVETVAINNFYHIINVFWEEKEDD